VPVVKRVKPHAGHPKDCGCVLSRCCQKCKYPTCMLGRHTTVILRANAILKLLSKGTAPVNVVRLMHVPYKTVTLFKDYMSTFKKD